MQGMNESAKATLVRSPITFALRLFLFAIAPCPSFRSIGRGVFLMYAALIILGQNYSVLNIVKKWIILKWRYFNSGIK